MRAQGLSRVIAAIAAVTSIAIYAPDLSAQGGAQATQSIGAPNRGRLTGGMRLRPTKHLGLRPAGRTWGLPVLVRLLRKASEEVAKKHKGSVLFVGDLSAKAGGPIEGHNSHQSGRDVDVGFFVANSKGKPVAVKRFVPFDSAGKGRDVPWARFDDARNWTLVEALLKDAQANVRYIFVATALRARLLAYAAKKQAPKELVARAAAAMISPKDADLHDDHFHVRVACPESMKSVCSEESLAKESAPPLAQAASSEKTIEKAALSSELVGVDAPGRSAETPSKSGGFEADTSAPH